MAALRGFRDVLINTTISVLEIIKQLPESEKNMAIDVLIKSLIKDRDQHKKKKTK